MRSLKIDYPKELNPAQLEAVRSTQGPHLIIAGAGSGKTRVLVFRTAYLVEKGVDPSRILLLTFTRKAAGEMLKRASEILDERCSKVAGGTFHSFANGLLRRHADQIRLPRHFTIIDQDDAENALQLVRTQQGFGKSDQRFPKKQTLLSLISKSVNTGLNIESILAEDYPHFSEWLGQIERIRQRYSAYKKDLGLLDYDDLLIYCRDLLTAAPQLRRDLSRQYGYIMVDEYQDTNKIQGEIVKLLCGEHKNIMVVGDDSQSIYSFRGAHFRNIIDFPKVFPGCKIILLEENYRSCQPILDLTNEVIKSASERFEKELFTQKPGRTRPVYAEIMDEPQQSRYIVNQIIRLVGQGVPLTEMAVLFRSGWHSNDLEVQLAGHRIPFVKYGGQKFVESSHIKDVVSFLRVLQNPADEISWRRILMLFPGIGEKTAGQILKEIIQAKKGFKFDGKILEQKKSLKRLFELYQDIDPGRQSPGEVLHAMLEMYVPILSENYDDYDKRLNDLSSLEDMVERYESLEAFLSDLALDPPEKSHVEAARAKRNTGCLTLSTVHSAKGLEWHTVFLIHLAEGYLPSYRAFDHPEAIEEERRLFYVATTRAKENLYLLRPLVNRNGRNMYDQARSAYTQISRFMTEGRILRELVAKEGLRMETLACSHPDWDRDDDVDRSDW